MTFDYVLFAKIILWGACIIGWTVALLGAAGMWVYYFTYSGRLKLLVMQMNGQRPTYRWSFLWIALISSVALYCM
jgi:hypothetical protein